jgi:hypothetical protein
MKKEVDSNGSDIEQIKSAGKIYKLLVDEPTIPPEFGLI